MEPQKTLLESLYLLKASDVAQILNLSKPMVYRLASTGELPSVKIGGCVRVRKEDLDEYVRKNWTGWKSI